MNAGAAIRRLGDCISRIEDAGYEVDRIADREGMIDGDAVGATLTVHADPQSEVTVPDDATLSVAEASVTEDGAVRIEFEVTVSEPDDATEGETDDRSTGPGSGGSGGGSTPRPVASPPVDGAEQRAPDGGIVTRARTADRPDAGTEGTTDAGGGTESVPENGGETPTAEDPSEGSVPDDGTEVSTPEAKSEDPAPGAGGDEPAYRDPDRLRAVYESCGTFPEMRDALGVDVTAQTVRKYAIEHGIHDPDSRTTNDDPAPEGEDTSDPPSGSSDLPAGVTIEDVKAAVRTARTLYDVQRDLGLDREETHELLEERDLLDLVRRRGSEVDSETPIETIEERLDSTTD